MSTQSRKSARVSTAISFCFCLVLSAGSVWAQAITGTAVGTVRDATGAVLSNANVTATNAQTGVAQSTVTTGAGDYTIPNLAPGRYKITAQSKGFATSVSPDVPIQVEQTTRVDFSLSPGQTTQQITVTGEAPLVQSTTSDLGHVIESQQIQALPLNGRLFEQLVTIVPGTIQAGWSDFAENPSAAGALTPTQAVVNGLPWSGNYYMVDGVHNTEPLNAFISISPPLDSVDSFKVETSNPNA
ncbi:MAG: carboxypeptidase regulatory-like domain-containing protein, partial [Acidobacteriaceae bacterium]|nr:carboxypeptidase regulatory-like domain-containing protein [Acidobacteriaceae bacterium]